MDGDITKLLHQINEIRQKYELTAELTGENFNVFSILNVWSEEVRLHSAFIAELLNPKGSHGQKDKYLRLFCEGMKIENLDTESAHVEVEKYIGFKNADETKGGRIDIVISDRNNHQVIIENKIYAGDQHKQLLRYFNYGKDKAKSFDLIYLTLDGHMPKEGSTGRSKEIDYKSISYKDDIVKWLEQCEAQSAKLPYIRETVGQYIHLLKKITNQSTSTIMKNEIAEIIAGNKEFYFSALEIMKSIEEVHNQKMKDFANNLEALIKNELGNGYKIEFEEPQNTDLDFLIKIDDLDYDILLYFNRKWGNFIGIPIKEGQKVDETKRTDLRKVLEKYSYGKIRNFDNWVWNAEAIYPHGTENDFFYMCFSDMDKLCNDYKEAILFILNEIQTPHNP